MLANRSAYYLEMPLYDLKTKVILAIVSILLSRFIPVYVSPYLFGFNYSDVLLVIILAIVTGKKNFVEWRHVFAIVYNPGFLLFLFVFILMLFIGLINYFDFKSSFGELRYHLYTLLAFMVVYKGIINDKYKLLWVVVITLVIDLLITIDQRSFNAGDLDPRVSFSPYLIFVTLYMLALFRKINLLLVISFISIFVSLYGGFRAGALVSILSLLLYLFVILFSKCKEGGSRHKGYMYLIIFVLFLAVYFGGERLIELISSDKVLNHYILIRTESFFSGLFDPSSRGEVFYQDYGRMEPFFEIYNDPLHFIFPHGFGVWGAFEEGFGLANTVRMNTLDNGYFYIAFHYGLIIGAIALILFVFSVMGSVLRERRSYYRNVKIVSVPIFLVLLAINAPLQGVGMSILMGVYLADLLRYSRIIKIIFKV